MQPNSRLMIERIAAALDASVLPALARDPWAASTVRSAVTLLNHLAKRVDLEAAILAGDIEDAKLVLHETFELMKPGADTTLLTDIAALLADDNPITYDIAALDARNTQYQSVFERLLRDQYEGKWTEAAAQPLRAAIRAYLARHLARERILFVPEFSGPPF
jgi:hypothetical protein